MTETPSKQTEPQGTEVSTDHHWNSRHGGPHVRLEIPVHVYSYGVDEQPYYDEGRTIEVSAYGGLLAIARPLAAGQSVLVINPKTGNKMSCRVGSVKQDESGVNHIRVEFETRSAKFWGIAFPADDRDPTEQKHPQPPEPASSSALPARSPESSVAAQKSSPKAGAEHEAAMPQNEGRITKLIRGRWRQLAWAGGGLVALLVFITFWTARSRGPRAGSQAEASPTVEGVAPEDARLIPNLGTYRLATERDFDPLAVSWLRGSGRPVSGDIPGLYSGPGESHAYVLIGKNHMRRVVILAGGQVRCDAQYRTVAIAARVPKGMLARITWEDATPVASEGDGLLVVRSASDPGSGVVLLLSGNEVVPRIPVDFHQALNSQAP
jgi:hypothetical protein